MKPKLLLAASAAVLLAGYPSVNFAQETLSDVPPAISIVTGNGIAAGVWGAALFVMVASTPSSSSVPAPTATTVGGGGGGGGGGGPGPGPVAP